MSLLASSVVGALSLPGVAAAGEDGATATAVCTDDGPAIQVSIDGPPGEKFYVLVDGDVYYPGGSESSGFRSAGYFQSKNLPVDGSGSHTWQVVWDSGEGAVNWENGSIYVDCEDAQDVGSNCNSITVNLPDKPGEGEPFGYVVTLFKNGEEIDSDTGSSGDSVSLSPSGAGQYVVVINRDQGNKTTEVEVTVTCSSGRRRTSNTTPLLPTTGSDSSTSLLILAPAMIALGGGLVLARRRMVKA